MSLENWFYECIGEALTTHTPGVQVRLEHPRQIPPQRRNFPHIIKITYYISPTIDFDRVKRVQMSFAVL